MFTDSEEKMIVLYGAGEQNLRMAISLLDIGEYKAEFVVDKDERKWGISKYELEVVSLERMHSFDEQMNKEGRKYDLLITARTSTTVEEIRKQLSSLKNAIVYSVYEYMYEKALYANVKSIGTLIVHLADHCNLNCVRCCHLSPLVKNEVFYDFEKYKKDLKRYSVLCDRKLQEIQLGGGEPLLNSNCEEYIRITRECFPESRIVLMTNGILLKKMPQSFFDSCRDNDIVVSITSYGVKLDWNGIKKLLGENEVAYNIANEEDWKDDRSKKMERPACLILNGGENAYKNNVRCLGAHIYILNNGKVYNCAYSAFISYFNNYYGTKLPDEDGVNIYEVNTYEELLYEISQPNKLCEYCRPNDSVRKDASDAVDWRISPRSIDEWADCGEQ
ncbi:MAG: 4Fe-4S cluster-binding domain-containing protein [Lachnospiraceae bacterium]|nr:4Fe-4S cluster-binding domain-containing protein [Lachnospiraceae bacterium]